MLQNVPVFVLDRRHFLVENGRPDSEQKTRGRRFGWGRRVEKRGHDEESVPEMFARRGVFFDGTDEVGGRTDDAVFSVRGVRESVEGELMMEYIGC